jgi:hypothetical protein
VVTIIYKNQTPVSVSDSAVYNGDLWIPVKQMKAKVGLELKPEGVCFEENCVPLPVKNRDFYLNESGCTFNLSAFSRLLGQPVIYDEKHHVWLLGEAGSVHRNRLQSLKAPDFTLPDLEGNLHSLSHFIGKKIFLVSWASW